ncbi:MAG: multicopper oxidase domain-containing protein, partial [Gemmatimonadetes bacterium]|nr:multicopper oxidase domain-containing protein [Gemmatimonadota bacterium]
MDDFERGLTRRRFLQLGGAAGAAAGLQTLVPGPVAGRGVPGGAAPTVLDGRDAEVEITIREMRWLVDGRERTAVTMNGSVPGPLLRLREGGEAVIHVHNE